MSTWTPPAPNPRNPPTPPSSGTSHARRRCRFAFARLGLAALLATLLAGAGCGRTIEYRPHDYDHFYQRRVLILEATPLPPLPEAVLKRVERRVEEGFQALPYLSRVIPREEARAALSSDRAAYSRYVLLSDVASVLSIAERELTLAMAKAYDADFVATIQALHLPCPHCETPDRIAVIAQMFEVKDAQLVWRISIREDVSRDAPLEEIEATIEGAADELLTEIDFHFRPKWQRLRFHHLKGPAPAESPEG